MSIPSLENNAEASEYRCVLGKRTLSSQRFHNLHYIVCGCLFLGGITSGVFLFLRKKRSIPTWLEVTVFTITAISIVAIVASFFLFTKRRSSSNTIPQYRSSPAGHPLYKKNEMSPFLNNLHHELCEMNALGVFSPVSNERVQFIIQQLAQYQEQGLLNAIPNYYLTNPPRPGVNKISHPFLTPLHYWCQKGNLEIVKILLDKRAHDYFTEGDYFYKLSSGVYQAALYGHPDVVNLLLKRGSRANVAFGNNNILFSFIPKLIFEMCELIPNEEKEDTFRKKIVCVDMLLTHLSNNFKENLTLQFGIPIKEGVNCVALLDEKISDSKIELTKKRFERLRELLISFGAKADCVFDAETLKNEHYNVGEYFTLYDISLFKTS